MKRSALILSIFLSILAFTSFYYVSFGQISGSEALKTSTYDLSDFKKIKLSHAIELEVVQGDRFEVEVTHNENLEECYNLLEKGGDW